MNTLINHTILNSYPVPTGIETEVLYTFSDGNVVKVIQTHSYPKNKEEIISNIISRGETELEKVNILANVPNILNELNN